MKDGNNETDVAPLPEIDDALSVIDELCGAMRQLNKTLDDIRNEVRWVISNNMVKPKTIKATSFKAAMVKKR